jgi:hypothetical protein
MRGLSRSSLRPLVALCALAACHVVRIEEDTARGETRSERRAGPSRPLPPRVELGADGLLRFVEPMVCATDSVTDLEITRVRRRSPNAATLVVGVIATAVGAIALVSGAASDDAGGSPLTYVGPLAIVGGVPLVVGPLIGNRTTRELVEVKPVRAPGEDERCGERPVAATGATLLWSGLRAVGPVDGDGRFATSPFAFVDAFAIAEAPPLALTIDLALASGRTLPLDAVIDQRALAAARDAWLAASGIDATIEPIRKVPRLEADAIRLTRAGGPGARALQFALPLRNVGPGDAFAVRLILSSTSAELDGRVVYGGRIPAHGDRVLTATLPISDEADRSLALGEVVLSARLRDAYDAAPETPIRFKGKLTGP